ncbi:unnamed protein product [Allacma fusca]|uniref:Carboxylic ester hydrolase n=1 Tax=Allacma fusca TaxID=39272 RepID=A0A8J2LR40_9HEXA|nr:unnamed protein product [Allacma fusca]
MEERSQKLEHKNFKFYFSIVAILVGYFLQANLFYEDGPIVQISTGKIQGRYSTSRDGRKFVEFLGIPYAKPPVDKLRFELPQLPEAWEGIRPANSDGPQCLGAELLTTGRIVGQEDCLYLNVHTPGHVNTSTTRMLSHGELLPVIVYIYGGGFFMGSTDIYGAKYFMDEDVVLVMMNYRLGALGFLDTGDGIVRGNMGLKDQNLALKWVQENIVHFGGNPAKVTLAGESAGGVSVHGHILSPMSKGLFHRAIVVSNTAANNDWALKRNSTETALELGKRVGCLSLTTDELVKCLRRTPSHQIMSAHLDHFNPHTDVKNLFLPTIEVVKDERAFLADDPMELMKRGETNKVPCMAGLIEYEGLVYALRFPQHQVNPLLLQNRLYRNKHLGRFIYHDKASEQQLDEIYDFYFNSSQNMNLDEMMISLSHLYTDRFMAAGMRNLALLHSQRSQVHLFYLTYQAQFNVHDVLRGTIPSSWIPFELQMAYHFTSQFLLNLVGLRNVVYGASHGDNVPLLFCANPVTEIRRFSQDYSFSKDFVKLYVDFAKDLKQLQFRGVDWQPAVDQNSSQLHFLKLDSKSEMIEDPFVQRMTFLNSLDM